MTEDNNITDVEFLPMDLIGEDMEDVIDDIQGEEASNNTVGHLSNEKEDKSPIQIFAEQWKAEGRLPDDFIVDKDTTEEKINDALYDFKVKKLVDDGIDKYLEENGIAKSDLESHKSRKLGIDPVLFENQQKYSELSKVILQEEDFEDEKNHDAIRDYLKLYYADTGLSQRKIDRQVESDMDDWDSLEESLKDANKYFTSKKKSADEAVSHAESKAIEASTKKREDIIEKNKSILNSKNISGLEIDDEQLKFLNKAFFDKNQTIKLPDGKIKSVTMYEKQVYEHTSDPAKALKMGVQFMLNFYNGDNIEEKTRKSILKQLNLTTTTNKNTKGESVGVTYL